VLSTSLANAAFELENGRVFESFSVRGNPFYIHRLFPNKPAEKVDRGKFPLVVGFFRDPVDRLVSLYKNRVLQKHEESRYQWQSAQQKSLNPSPTFDEFVGRLWEYRSKIAEIKHHAQPQHIFLGRPGDLDRLFLFSQVNQFNDFMSERLGRDFFLPRFQSSISTESPKVSDRALRAVENLYTKDFQFLEKAMKIGLVRE
jgi:hypothetical protein